MTYNITKIEKVLKEWNLLDDYILIPAGDKPYYFVAINRDALNPELSSELLNVAEEEGWDAQYCPDPETHIADGDVSESWEDNITVLNLM